MVNNPESISHRIFIPSLTLGCCLLIVLLISVQFVWHLRYQSLQLELTELKAANSELLMKHDDPNRILLNSQQATQSSPSSIECVEPHKIKVSKSLDEPLKSSDDETHQDIFREMFEDEYSDWSDSDIDQSGEQVLKDAVQGHLSDDPEYRLDAAIALREIRGRALEPQLAASLLNLAENIEDPALQKEILWTLEGAVDATSLPQLRQYLQHADPEVRRASAYLFVQGVLSAQYENSLFAQQQRADFVEHIRKNPDQFLDYYAQAILNKP